MTVDVAELRALLARATPGPWESYAAPCCPDMGGVATGRRDVLGACIARYGHSALLVDAKLIAAAVNALPQLLAVYEAAAALADELDAAGQIGSWLPSAMKLCDAVDAARGAGTEGQ